MPVRWNEEGPNKFPVIFTQNTFHLSSKEWTLAQILGNLEATKPNTKTRSSGFHRNYYLKGST